MSPGLSSLFSYFFSTISHFIVFLFFFLSDCLNFKFQSFNWRFCFSSQIFFLFVRALLCSVFLFCSIFVCFMDALLSLWKHSNIHFLLFPVLCLLSLSSFSSFWLFLCLLSTCHVRGLASNFWVTCLCLSLIETWESQVDALRWVGWVDQRPAPKAAGAVCLVVSLMVLF